MTDIVERLRNFDSRSSWDDMANSIDEAADEIERLRDMLGRAQEEAGELLHAKANLHSHLKRLEDENAKLRSLLAMCRSL